MRLLIIDEVDRDKSRLQPLTTWDGPKAGRYANGVIVETWFATVLFWISP